MAVRTQLYACEPTFLENYLNRTLNATPTEITAAQLKFGPSAKAKSDPLDDDDDDDDDEPDSYREQGDEAVISINGVLSQDGPSWIAQLFGFQGTAYSDILVGIARAEANPNISRLTLRVNSPGGDVGGVDQVWQALRAFSKPTKAINTNLMASAAYYIASACDQILAETPNAETGSIGCVFAGYDDTDALGAEGVKRVRIYSANATRKDSNVDTEAGRAELQLRADAQERNFIDRVATGRSIPYAKVKSDFGNGAVFVAQDVDGSKPNAVSVGLIDGMAYLGDLPAPITVSPRPSLPGITNATDSQTTTRARAQGEKTMLNLDALLEANPQAKAEYQARITAADKAGADRVQSRIDQVKTFLDLKATDTGYDQTEVESLRALATQVILGTEEPAAVRSFARMVDMQVEKRKVSGAQTQTKAQGETAPTTAGGNPVLAKAVSSLGQKRVDEVMAYCQKNGVDLAAALNAEIEYTEARASLKKGA